MNRTRKIGIIVTFVLADLAGVLIQFLDTLLPNSSDWSILLQRKLIEHSILLVLAVLAGYCLFTVGKGSLRVSWRSRKELESSVQSGTFQWEDCIFTGNPQAIKKIKHICNTKRIMSTVILVFAFLLLRFHDSFFWIFRSPLNILVDSAEFIAERLADLYPIMVPYYIVHGMVHSPMLYFISSLMLQYLLMIFSVWWFLKWHFRIKNPKKTSTEETPIAKMDGPVLSQ